MTKVERIKRSFERGARAVAISSKAGRGTAVTTTRLADGLTCEVEEGPWRLTVDLAEKHGGDNRGPNSGVLGRGALGSCLAITYAMWAAKMDVPITSLEVDVRADYDSRQTYGVGERRAGYSAIRYVVRVESPAPEAKVMAMLDEADRHCAYLDVFANPTEVTREVEFAETEGGRNE
jgi:uncharacterized OsmC-like protein